MTDGEEFTALTDDEKDLYSLFVEAFWMDRVAKTLGRDAPDVRPMLMRVVYEGKPRAIIAVAGTDDEDRFVVRPIAMMLDRSEVERMEPPGNPEMIEI